MTKQRYWPNNAKEARDRAAEEAQAGIKALEPVVHGECKFDNTDVLRRQARALSALQKIARLMEQQGAPTRPA